MIGDDLRTYRVYGVHLATDFPFANRLPAGPGPADLSFTVGEPPLHWDRAQREPLYASTRRTERGESWFSVWRLPLWDVLCFAGLADFYVSRERIACHLSDPGQGPAAEIQLLGPVLSCWLERAGLPCLHGSAVVVDGCAIGFLGFNHGGKSCLAAAILQAGHALLTDDVMAVEPVLDGFHVRPGYPQMRLWPAEADWFLGSAERFPRVSPDQAKLLVPVGPDGLGEFEPVCRPLACLYLPQRSDAGGVRIEPLHPRAAVIELLRHSFIGPFAEASGWRERRLDRLSELAVRVPVRRLIYPNGLERLSRVREAILANVTSSRG